MMIWPATIIVLVLLPSLNADGQKAYSTRGQQFDGKVDGRRIVKRSTTRELRLLSSYAHTGRPIETIRLGQCAVEKKRILLNDVPPQFIAILSSLGEAPRVSIVVLPKPPRSSRRPWDGRAPCLEPWPAITGQLPAPDRRSPGRRRGPWRWLLQVLAGAKLGVRSTCRGNCS